METAIAYEFKDSETQDVSKTLLVAVAGPTGAGKTESGMRIAKGIVGPHGTFAVIDTENKRALNKKGRYRFQHLDMQPPYTPQNFWGAIQAAIKAGHGAVFVDSFSAEWDGEGGLHDQATDILERLTKGDADKAHAMQGLAWKQPKMDHKRFMAYLRKCDVPIIFGLRAEPKIKYVKDEKGKTQVVDAGWLPITEKLFGYDMLVYALMMAENPGVPVHLKKLEPEFEAMFPVGKQINEDCGRLLAQWAAGGQAPGEKSVPHNRLDDPKGMPTDSYGPIQPDRSADLSILKADYDTRLEQAKTFKEAMAVKDDLSRSDIPLDYKQGFEVKMRAKFAQGKK